MKQKLTSIAALAGCALIALTAVQPAQAAGRRPSDIVFTATEVGTVTNVIDGQTIQVSLDGGGTETVRYIGISAPAIGACMGIQARNANAALMMGQRVRMESDVVDAAPDNSYVWRYVYQLNATMGGEEMIKGGYAQSVSVPPNIKHQGDLNNLRSACCTTVIASPFTRLRPWMVPSGPGNSSITRPAPFCP